MKKFYVYGVIGATTMTAEVEAANAEEASEKFTSMNECSPSICHQCSHEVEINEIYEINVLDETHKEVYSDRRESVYKDRMVELLKSEKTKEEILNELTSEK